MDIDQLPDESTSMPVLRGKKQRVKPYSPICRDKFGKTIALRNREQTWLTVKMPRRFDAVKNENGLVNSYPALFSETVEPDDKAESRSAELQRASLIATKEIVRLIANGTFARARTLSRDLFYKGYSQSRIDAELAHNGLVEFSKCDAVKDLEFLAKSANVCLKCHKANKAVERQYTGINRSNPQFNDFAKCRPIYLPVVIDGKPQYALWLGYAKGKAILGHRKMKKSRTGKPLPLYDVLVNDCVYPVAERVTTTALCKCKM